LSFRQDENHNSLKRFAVILLSSNPGP